MSKYKLRGMYGRPLVRGTPLESDPDLRVALDRAGKQAVHEIKKEIRRLTFKGSPKRILDSLSYEVVGKKTLRITSDHPGSKFLNQGVRRYQMTHLVKATRPIPIIKDNGELIFRNATPAGMRDGKLVHPGFRGKNFVDRGIEKAKDAIKEEIAEDIRKQVLKRWRGR